MPDWGKSGELTAAQTELMANIFKLMLKHHLKKSIDDMKNLIKF